MVTTLLNLRVKCALKYSAFVILFLISFYYLRSVSYTVGNPVIHIGNVWHKSVGDSDNTDINGYKNSQKLVEKLRPKLVTSNTSDHHGEPVWNELNIARSQQEVTEREEGYKQFAFNTLVR